MNLQNDPRLKNMHPLKREILLRLSNSQSTMTPEQMLPQLMEINKELQETQYISPTQLLVQNVELADGDQVSVATQSNSSTKKVLSRTDYLTYNEDNGELMSQESYQAKKSAKAMIERLKEQHEKAQADEQADDGQTQEETTTEETTPELSLTPAPASTPES